MSEEDAAAAAAVPVAGSRRRRGGGEQRPLSADELLSKQLRQRVFAGGEVVGVAESFVRPRSVFGEAPLNLDDFVLQVLPEAQHLDAHIPFSVLSPGESPLQRPATLVLDRPSSSYFLADFTNSRRQHGSVEAPLRVLVGPFRRLFTRRRPSVEKALDEAAPSLYNPLPAMTEPNSVGVVLNGTSRLFGTYYGQPPNQASARPPAVADASLASPAAPSSADTVRVDAVLLDPMRDLQLAENADRQPRPPPRRSRVLRMTRSATFCPCFSPAVSDDDDEFEASSSTVMPRHLRQRLALAAHASNQPPFTRGARDPQVHLTVQYAKRLVHDIHKLFSATYYWGVMDRYKAEELLEGKPEGTFLLRDSAQSDYLFSVSFRRYGRTLHARVEQANHHFGFDVHDDSVFRAPSITELIANYKDPARCLFFEPQLTHPLHRNFVFSLQQLCRARIVASTTYDAVTELHLPKKLKAFIRDYHYTYAVGRTEVG